MLCKRATQTAATFVRLTKDEVQEEIGRLALDDDRVLRSRYLLVLFHVDPERVDNPKVFVERPAPTAEGVMIHDEMDKLLGVCRGDIPA